MMRTLHLNDSMTISNHKKEVRTDRFAFGYLFWLFIVFCFIGYIFETLVAFIEFGNYQSKSGLIYGPFSQVYGIGALLSVLLYKIVRQSSLLSQFLFFSGSGALFEFSAGSIEEKVFGSSSWDYSSHLFSFGTGRTDLLYSLVWGLSALIITHKVYPFIIRSYDSLRVRTSSLLTLAFAIFLMTDMLITFLAVYRYSERNYDKPPSNAIETRIDLIFPDNKMEGLFPTMLFMER